ncbi:hypothetical protein EDB19DRAFT_1829247 [Suillus lakei]|nr:hypothetical protein EDB19DRAFT_1829247 [Suillus lakei]
MPVKMAVAISQATLSNTQLMMLQVACIAQGNTHTYYSPLSGGRRDKQIIFFKFARYIGWQIDVAMGRDGFTYIQTFKLRMAWFRIGHELWECCTFKSRSICLRYMDTRGRVYPVGCESCDRNVVARTSFKITDCPSGIILQYNPACRILPVSGFPLRCRPLANSTLNVAAAMCYSAEMILSYSGRDPTSWIDPTNRILNCIRTALPQLRATSPFFASSTKSYVMDRTYQSDTQRYTYSTPSACNISLSTFLVQ